MKATILACVLFITVFAGRSQNYLPFPDSAAIWVNATLVVNQGFYGDYICSNGNDTLINSNLYSVFEDCISGSYRGAYRDSLGKVYIVPKDSIKEFVLYDFYASPGDTLIYYQEEFGPGLEEYIVQPWDTGMLQLNGINRKTVQVGIGKWIEGIGSDKGLLTSQYDNVSNYVIWLYCMSARDTIEYGYSVTGGGWGTPQQIINLPCDFILGNQELEHTEFRLHPNPAKDEVVITLDGLIESFQLVDMKGLAFIPNWNFTNGQFYVAVNDVTRGVYIVLVKTQEGQVLRSLLVLD